MDESEELEDSEEEFNIDEILKYLKSNLDILEDKSKKLNINDLRNHITNLTADIYFLFALLKNKSHPNGSKSMYS